MMTSVLAVLALAILAPSSWAVRSLDEPDAAASPGAWALKRSQNGFSVVPKQSFRQIEPASAKDNGWAGWKVIEPKLPDIDKVTSNHAWDDKHVPMPEPRLVSKQGEEELPSSPRDVHAVDTASLRSTMADSAEGGSAVERLVGTASNMKLKDFMPKCTKRLRTLILDIDNNYGDAQLHTTLVNYCSHGQEFPVSHGDSHGFQETDSCENFAADLEKVRFEELRTNSQEGYSGFCKAFYQHHGGLIAATPKKRPPKEPKTYSSSRRVSEPLVAAIVTAVAVVTV